MGFSIIAWMLEDPPLADNSATLSPGVSEPKRKRKSMKNPEAQAVTIKPPRSDPPLMSCLTHFFIPF